MEKLTRQEEELMLIIWQRGKGFIKDFIQDMPQPHPPYTTVASVAKNLERKGYLRATRYGNTYEYAPAVDERDYKARCLSAFAQNYFKNSYKEMVCFFAREQKISARELEDIIRQIENGHE